LEIIRPGGMPISLESLTNLYGLVYGVSVPPAGKIRLSRSVFTLSRNVDLLSLQFAAALASLTRFPKVTIQTHSGHVVTLQNVLVVEITKAGYRNTIYPVSPIAGPGMEAITWEGGAPIRVDGTVQHASYNWLGLNS
jgi:hypothetical protein